MIRRLLRHPPVWFALFFAFIVAGCSGGNSASEEPSVLVPQTFNEDCMLCHRAESIADVEVVHSRESNSPQGVITGVTIDGVTGRVTVAFKLFESENNLVPIAGMSENDIRFTIAKLVTVNGVTTWQSYINDTETKEAGDPGTAPDGTTTVQADFEGANDPGGVFTDNGDGTYSYQFSFDITNVTAPIPVLYEPGQTHRIAIQITDNFANPFVDFVPNDLPTLNTTNATRDIVANASCNECHLKLGLHGGERIQVEYCATCHNPGTTDANSNNTVNFTEMIHKIHTGEDLPEVQAGGEYAIWGFRNSKHDYSTVVFPQDLRNCTKCHDGADAETPDGDNWKNVPGTVACTSCHDDPESPEYPNFPNLTPTEIETAHEIPEQIAGEKFKYNILSVSDPNDLNVDPGDLVKVTFSVTNPTNSDMPYNILNDPAFTSTAGGASRLAILIGWDSTDYTNTGSGSHPAQPISINPLSIGSTPAADNNNGTFSVTSAVAIPDDVVGSGVVAIEGHPAGDFDGDGTFSDRVPVTSVVMNFPITDFVAVNRREVVDIDNCLRCHGVLSLHGNNRTNEPQVCVICHNANATDIEVRPDPPETGVDGKVEEAIDFKYMIHSIHAGAVDDHGFRQEGMVVYGFGGSVNDFSHVRLPAGIDNLRNCVGCHDGNTFEVPLDENVLPTTVLTENEADPDDDKNITPTASVCSSCHDSLESKTHMAEEGGLFDFVASAPAVNDTGGSQVELCGPGPISSQPAGHTESLSCCSCHGFR